VRRIGDAGSASETFGEQGEHGVDELRGAGDHRLVGTHSTSFSHHHTARHPILLVECRTVNMAQRVGAHLRPHGDLFISR
jgi:hypothetical protein